MVIPESDNPDLGTFVADIGQYWEKSSNFGGSITGALLC